MDTLPVVWQYGILGVGALLLTIIGLKLYNRRERRRKHALELANLMRDWELSWFATAYEMYAVGDYSGLVHKIKEVVQAVRSDEAMVAKLLDVTKKVCTYVAANDATKAAELQAILQAKKPSPA